MLKTAVLILFMAVLAAIGISIGGIVKVIIGMVLLFICGIFGTIIGIFFLFDRKSLGILLLIIFILLDVFFIYFLIIPGFEALVESIKTYMIARGWA